ncbi:uncharacterized protein LOC126184721 isoform X2 [Schistocerca cancellata]|nr:uncharacterized protein LOC126184721 isoform X2 [Schistocerca cancellata]XP_049783204.1 uncharacterized protein LOC126184721 isoform X2 [Schistocerca cancellata]XP_049783205.1 uncharacterized protein LOC126184721 isoform X2 [Schistocerca cancellata]
MYCAILIAAIILLSPPVINAEKGDEDDNWVDPFYIDSKMNTAADDWMDPLDLEGHRNLQKTLIKSSSENVIIKQLPEESKNAELPGNVESTKKNLQINEEMEVSTNMLEKNEGESTETESKTKSDENLPKEDICRCAKNEMEHNFLRRFINLLVNICVSKNNEIQKKISVTLEISPEELKQLQRLKDDTDVAPAIRLLNTIISDMKFNDHEEDYSSFFHGVIRMISSKEVWMEIGVISFAILPSFLFILGGRITRIICITLLMTFSVSYYGTYRFLRMKAREKNERILSDTLTCTPQERSWYHSIFGSSSDSECQKRWNALHIDPSDEVTPVNVISHMIGVIIFQPLEQFGIMFSSFSTQIFESQPFLRGMVVYATAVMIIISVIFFCCYGLHGRSRGLGSHNYPYTFAGQRFRDTEPDASSFHPDSRSQIFNPRGRNSVPGSSYEALPQQPVYIITNYTDRIPKNSLTKKVRIKQQLPGKGESSSSKKKSGKSLKRNTKNNCIINDNTEINNVSSDKIETTDDETL